MKKSGPLVFFGTERFSEASLTALIEAGWVISAVVTKPDSKSGRGQFTGSPAVKKIAEDNNIRIFQPSQLTQIEQDLVDLRPSHGVLVAYGKIIPPSIINLFPGGIINLHPSLLPKYRGPAPIEAPILNGDKQTGLSLMRLTAGMDEGPVYFQEAIPLDKEETRLSLSDKLSKQGAKLLVDKLPDIIGGRLSETPQDDSRATYTRLLRKEDGLLDWGEPSQIIERKVRAYLGFPKTRAKIFGHEVVIIKTRIAKDAYDGALVMECRPGWVEILRLITPNGKTASGEAFLRGYKKP